MAEEEYIERDAALDIVNGWRDQLIPTYGKNDEYVKCLETVAEHLESLHAADVRPVVTCADCKHWARIKKDCILASCDLDALVRCEDFYCANGEKREES